MDVDVDVVLVLDREPLPAVGVAMAVTQSRDTNTGWFPAGPVTSTRSSESPPLGLVWHPAGSVWLSVSPVGLSTARVRLPPTPVRLSEPGMMVAGTVMVKTVSMLACPATRSVRALPRAASMWVHTPSLTYWWARASMAAHAVAASSEGKVPSHLSTPGSATHRRNPHPERAFSARWRSRSGLIRANARRQRRRRCAPSSTSKCPSSIVTTVSRTSTGAASSSSATTEARYGSSRP